MTELLGLVIKTNKLYMSVHVVVWMRMWHSVRCRVRYRTIHVVERACGGAYEYKG
jgi:hypothetical protein